MMRPSACFCTKHRSCGATGVTMSPPEQSSTPTCPGLGQRATNGVIPVASTALVAKRAPDLPALLGVVHAVAVCSTSRQDPPQSRQNPPQSINLVRQCTADLGSMRLPPEPLVEAPMNWAWSVRWAGDGQTLRPQECQQHVEPGWRAAGTDVHAVVLPPVLCGGHEHVVLLEFAAGGCDSILRDLLRQVPHLDTRAPTGRGMSERPFTPSICARLGRILPHPPGKKRMGCIPRQFASTGSAAGSESHGRCNPVGWAEPATRVAHSTEGTSRAKKLFSRKEGGPKHAMDAALTP
jgi:hypothetical protein